jgi:hypothetical protein
VERSPETGRAHLEGVAAGHGVDLVEDPRELLGDLLDDVGLDRLLGVEDDAEHPPATLTTKNDLEHLDPMAGCHPVGQILDMRR